MKKKIHYLVLLFILLIPITNVNAESFSNNTVLDVCGFSYVPSKLPSFVSGLYNIAKLLVPVILIIMGMIDFTKAMMASDEKKMKESQKSFINRLIAGIIIFLIMAVVQFVFNQLDASNFKTGFSKCMNCILNDKGCGTAKKLDRTTCDMLDQNECSGKDFTGATCKLTTVSNTKVCRAVCSSLTTKYRCASNSHCSWTGSNFSGSCINRPKKTYTGGTDTGGSSSEGQKIVEYAKKFVGHPYVYGGNNLCSTWDGVSGCGVDCSSFVQIVYRKFGYELPRTADTQSVYSKGKKITSFGDNYENLQPGDLLFYNGNNGIGHVTMYIGNGEVVHASSSTTGIIISKMNYRTAAWAMRFVS